MNIYVDIHFLYKRTFNWSNPFKKQISYFPVSLCMGVQEFSSFTKGVFAYYRSSERVKKAKSSGDYNKCYRGFTGSDKFINKAIRKELVSSLKEREEDSVTFICSRSVLTEGLLLKILGVDFFKEYSVSVVDIDDYESVVFDKIPDDMFRSYPSFEYSVRKGVELTDELKSEIFYSHISYTPPVAQSVDTMAIDIRERYLLLQRIEDEVDSSKQSV